MNFACFFFCWKNTVFIAQKYIYEKYIVFHGKTNRSRASPKYNKTKPNPTNKENQQSTEYRQDEAHNQFHKNGSVKQSNQWPIIESRIIISDELMSEIHSPIITTLSVGEARVSLTFCTPSSSEDNQNSLKKLKSNFWKSKSS